MSNLLEAVNQLSMKVSFTVPKYSHEGVPAKAKLPDEMDRFQADRKKATL